MLLSQKMTQYVCLRFVLVGAVMLGGCAGLDPSRQLQRNALEIGELKDVRRVAVIPAPGELTVWCQRGRIKATGAVAAGTTAAAIGVGAIAAAGVTTTATGAVVVAMTPAAAVATAGIAVAAAAAVIALDAVRRQIIDAGMEKALAAQMAFRPERAICRSIQDELTARYGIEVVNVDGLTSGRDCDLVVLVRTWKYGLFRIYARKHKKPLRPFELVSIHVLRVESLSEEMVECLKELNSLEPNRRPSRATQAVLDDPEIWFGHGLGEPVAASCRFLIGRAQIPARSKELSREAGRIEAEIKSMNEKLGQRYGFHMALAIR